MPPTAAAFSRAPGNDGRARGLRADLARRFEVRVGRSVPLLSANAVARCLLRAFVCVAAPMLALGANAAFAQTPAAQIYIAGPGERAGADAAQMSAMLDTRAQGRVSTTETPRNGDAQNGLITIPGPGERGAAVSASAAPNIITIPAPTGAALPRVNVNTSASAVAPVVVEPAQTANRNDAVKQADARALAVQRYVAAAAHGGASGAAAATAEPKTIAQAQPAAQVPPGQQDGESIRAAAAAFLKQQSAGLPGRVAITVAPVFPRGLAACTQLQPFMPPGARTWGRTTVGVRCIGEKPWTLYVSARVAVAITYYTAARQIEPGQTLSVADLVPRDGDLASLPRTVVTDPSQAAGALALLRISAGLPLRTDMLRSASSVVIGQTVRVEAEGANFTISSEGSVLNNAAPGQQVRVRTSGGQIITGVVKDAGTVQVPI